MSRMPRITNDLDKVKATLRFRRLKLIETVALVEEIEQLRASLKEAGELYDELRAEAYPQGHPDGD